MSIDIIRQNFRAASPNKWNTVPVSELEDEEVARIKRDGEIEEIVVEWEGTETTQPYTISIAVADGRIPVVDEDTLHEAVNITGFLRRILR